MDLLPTLSRLAGLEEPPPLEIDGVDLTNYILGANPDCPNDTFYYYNHHDLEAVRVGDWKLHFKKRRRPARKNLPHSISRAPCPGRRISTSERIPVRF